MWNNRLFLFVVLVCLASCTGRNISTEQSAVTITSDSTHVSINGHLEVDGVWSNKWIHRYSADVEELVAEADADPRQDIDVLFFGSSSINLWSGLDEMMAPLQVVNRGYGGSTVRDVLVNFDKVMADYNPKAFVVYIENDLAGDPNLDLSVGVLFDHFRLIFKKLSENYPEVPVFCLSMKHSEHRIHLREKQALFNALMEDYAATVAGLTYVDVNSTLLRPDGSINSDLFEADKLHINREGYLRWTSVLKPLLADVCMCDCENVE